MNAMKETETRAEVIKLAHQGMSRAEIRNVVKVDYRRVKRWLDEIGYAHRIADTTAPPRLPAPHRIWSTDDPELKKNRIAKRAAKGAREALQAMGAV